MAKRCQLANVQRVHSPLNMCLIDTLLAKGLTFCCIDPMQVTLVPQAATAVHLHPHSPFLSVFKLTQMNEPNVLNAHEVLNASDTLSLL